MDFFYRFYRFAFNFSFLIIVLVVFPSCLTSSSSLIRESDAGNAYLQFKVLPKGVEGVFLEVDDGYYGLLSRWEDGIVRLPAGARRVVIGAPGYISQRFDFGLKRHSQQTFTITLEKDEISELESDLGAKTSQNQVPLYPKKDLLRQKKPSSKSVIVIEDDF